MTTATPATVFVSERLARLELLIDHGLRTAKQSFIDVGESLRKIQNRWLYKDQYETFEDYCLKRWGFSRPQAYRLMEAADVVKNLVLADVTKNLSLSPIGDKVMPANEAQTRPLAKLPPEKQPEAWQRAVEKAGDGKVTATVVEEAVREVGQEEGSAGSISANTVAGVAKSAIAKARALVHGLDKLSTDKNIASLNPFDAVHLASLVYEAKETLLEISNRSGIKQISTPGMAEKYAEALEVEYEEV